MKMVKKAGKCQRSKQKFSDLCPAFKVLDPAHLLFYAHRLFMSYIIAMLILVSCKSTHDRLLYFARFCAESTPKIANKNMHTTKLCQVS